MQFGIKICRHLQYNSITKLLAIESLVRSLNSEHITKMYFTALGIDNFDIRWICDTSEEFAEQDPCLYSGCYATNCQLQIG